MEFFDEKIDDLLAKRLAGECSPEEEKALERWLDESPEHRKHLEDLQWLWESSSKALTPAPRPVDTEAALARVKSRLYTGAGGVYPLRGRRDFWIRIAAVFLGVVAAVYWWQSGKEPEPVQIIAVGSALTDTLTDGSVVTLERQSGVVLAGGFNRRERRLRLEGRAFFEVASDTTRPFVVEVQELEVQVVGTAFTVDNASNPDMVIVTVNEGRVRVSGLGRVLLLSAGEQAIYNRKSKTLERTIARPEQGTPYGRIFRYDATPLGKVIEDINRQYNARIIIKNKALENCLLTGYYNNLSLERFLELIAETFALTMKQEGDTYILEGTACGE